VLLAASGEPVARRYAIDLSIETSELQT